MSESAEPETYLTVRIALPQQLESILSLLNAVARQWPEAKTVPNQVDGWTITVEAET